MNEIQQRWNAPTPPFFKRIQKVGMVLMGVGTAILAAPVSLPASITLVGGYILTGGTVLSAVAQFAKQDGDNSGNLTGNKIID
ncbi:hypothetical protein KIH41_17035 [Litoribacter ruber]|uniref:hypothetical protein n=1 Tax=Litoribacter ruber TaxID=702568 RepID=UPI001BDA5B8C|nr:hypothetical protein [Litoribacter ruber]MBT0812995.1 hypothetical protein [Litoribacter ruber]